MILKIVSKHLFLLTQQTVTSLEATQDYNFTFKKLLAQLLHFHLFSETARCEFI